MLAGAVRAYLNRFAVLPGRRAVVFCTHDESVATLSDLAEAGIEVAAVVDPRAAPPDTVRAAAAAAGATLHAGSVVRDAQGRLALQRVVLGGKDEGCRIDCDLLAVSGGWNPAVHLASHHGGKPVWREDIAAFVPGDMPPGMIASGAAAGDFLLRDAVRAALPDARNDAETVVAEPLWQVHGARGKVFVDFQNDVTGPDITIAAREGFSAVEHLKRYTTLGMATDQGKTSNVTGLAIMAELTGRSMPQTGTTMFRPPYTPVAIGAMAGHHRGRAYKPTRLTPAHAWAARHGAVFIEAGEWMRASHFPQASEATMQASINREVAAVRTACGFCDVSTLGKIDVQGPDAGAFLDLLYANAMGTLRPGRVRYGLMLREDGFAFDDGTVARFSATHFLITTTTANAGAVLRHMEFCRQVIAPHFDVCFEPVTDQWAQFAVAGPRARDVVATVVDGDIGGAAFPFMAAAEVPTCLGVAARLFRISFSGALAYEIAVPARHGETLADALLAAGAVPYGLEALNVLRLEKGHPVGAELNGQTTAADLGMGRMVPARRDCIGRAMTQRPALLHPERPALVGVRPVSATRPLAAGAHILPAGAADTAANDQGYVTSTAYSSTLGGWIGLALVAGGEARIGETMRAVDLLRGTDVAVDIVPRVFFDPEGTALHA
jgi:sarcosine oxidase subunit alpha